MTETVWMYEDQIVTGIEDMPEGTIGFTYKITNLDTQQYYVGKKSVYSTVTRPPLKGMKRKRKFTKESSWLTYMSSNKDVQKWINVKKEILYYADTKIKLTYFENKGLYCNGVLEDDLAMNGNISGKIYKEHIKGSI